VLCVFSVRINVVYVCVTFAACLFTFSSIIYCIGCLSNTVVTVCCRTIFWYIQLAVARCVFTLRLIGYVFSILFVVVCVYVKRVSVIAIGGKVTLVSGASIWNIRCLLL
jgi:hypothetical protein